MVAVLPSAKAQQLTPEEQLKELQAQVALLKQQIELTTLQQTEQSKLAQSVADALKARVTTQNELTKLQAESEFAKLAGIKAGLEAVGTPPGKDGKLTITTGSAGALMLDLKRPMLQGLDAAAEHVAQAAKKNEAKLGGGVVLATDAEIQSALQSEVTKQAIADAVVSIDASIDAVEGGGLTASSITATVAAVGLALSTLTEFSKFFRADRSMTVFDAGEEPNEILRLLLERQLTARQITFVRLDDVNPEKIVVAAKAAQSSLNVLAGRYEKAVALLAEIDKLPPADPLRPSADKIDRLKGDAALAKELLDGLHPARKPEAFWAYVSGLYKHERMKPAGTYLARVTATAKAQTVQVIESRVFRSDAISGTADAQVEYRIVDKEGALAASGVWLWTSKQPSAPLILAATASSEAPAAAGTPALTPPTTPSSPSPPVSALKPAAPAPTPGT